MMIPLLRVASSSHPTMGAWIEIYPYRHPVPKRKRRTPRWVRGLKSSFSFLYTLRHGSHPTMGAWIEIKVCIDCFKRITGRTPRWVRGLKCRCFIHFHFIYRRTPRWVRGLKYKLDYNRRPCYQSHPTMGAWIEIL